MSERVAAYALASGARHAPPESGLGPAAVALRATCLAQQPYVGAVPMYQYGTLSAPVDECVDYEITEVLTHRLRETTQSEPSAELGDKSESKNCVDYQFLEQNISHQSILNQSISILNRQVCGRNGVSASAVRAVDCAVKPDLTESSQDITVPLGWKRIISNTSVVYISPSGCALPTPLQLRDYLQTPGTCKCGLECPLRPDTVFSFDPHVASKPYQVATGSELTKLCNHKRKLPTAQPVKKGGAAEAGMLKQKSKKKLQPGVSMSQMMAQRERVQQGWLQHQELPAEMSGEVRTMGPGTPLRSSQAGPVGNASHAPADPGEHGSNVTGPHYLTVNPIHSGQRVVGYHQTHTPLVGGNPTINIGQPVLGTNGQIIGVHTGGAKIEGQMRNFPYNHQLQERKQIEERAKTGETISRQSRNQSGTPENSENLNVFCGGLNQVPPEVVQKIDQQQQIFIQQNQKQIQMAMKGIRMQPAAENQTVKVFDNVPSGQLIIQNGTVMKANPAKTPPWHARRSDASPGPAQSPVRESPTHKPETEDPHQAVITGGDNFNLLQNFERNVQMMQSRVPPLHLNYQPTLLRPDEPNKKKTKTSPNKKKKIHVTELRNITFGNNGLKEFSDSKGNPYGNLDSNPSPSFMDDPSGYLAQQTALLNNTISRQVNSNARSESPNAQEHKEANSGMNQNMSKPNGSMHQAVQQRNIPQRNHMNNALNHTIQVTHFQQQMERQGMQQPCVQHQLPQQHSNMEYHHPGVQFMHSDVRYKEQNRSNENLYNSVMSHHVSPPQNVPDSSIVTEKTADAPRQCCQGTNHQLDHQHHVSEQQQRVPFVKHHGCSENMLSMETDGQSNSSSPRRGYDDNPVTSSTYMDLIQQQGCLSGDSRGPIQGGTVSTSRVSPPEQSPTPSNRSDTPHPIPSPARTDPTTPSPGYYASPGTPNHSINLTGSQMMNFISNHNVNKNLMEVGNISLTGANAIVKGPILGIAQRNEHKRPAGSIMIPGYCPPPHLGGGPSHSLSQTDYVQGTVTTMASGHTVMRDTITSVLAGKAHTATTSVSRLSNMRSQHPPNLASYAIPPNLPDPFLNSVNLPTSYPLHIAGSVTQNIINKSPMEIVQNVVSNMATSRHEPQGASASSYTGQRVHSGQILISSTGQIIMPHQNGPMPPPAPKGQNNGASLAHASSAVANPTQVLPTGGGVQQVINQPTVLVNTLPAPFVLQPQVMTVDGQVVQHNSSQILPQIVTGGLVSQGQSSNDAGDSKPGTLQRVAMLSPESAKKKGKKRKGHSLTNVLHIAAPQQSPAGVVLHHSTQQHTGPQFSPRGFQLSPNSMSSTPMLQALTIVPGKSGTPAHIVMNGQGVSGNFGSQQIITNTSPTQQINLLQPVNLINNASGVVPNFQTFQQFIVPNIGGMVMTADGTIIQDSSTGVPVQLHLQNVNGQNVLTPIQNQSMLTGGNAGVVIRTQNPHGKIVQSPHSPGAQFLSPNGHIMMNSPTFGGQLSPLVANVSPTAVNFASPHRVRSASVQQQEMIQCNQMGQAVVVPLSPKRASGSNGNGSTFVRQNTTIVQHQTTLVSASNDASGNRLSIDPAMLFDANAKQKRERSTERDKVGGNYAQAETEREKAESEMKRELNQLLLSSEAMVGHVRHSVSTQTLASQQPRPVYSSSPPDTTTHSPLGPLERVSSSPRIYTPRAATYADTTTSSPEPADSNSSGMVQCVSSSEPDVPESREGWPDQQQQHALHVGMMASQSVTQTAPGRPARPYVESSDAYQTISVSSLNNTRSLTITPNTFAPKRRHAEPPPSGHRDKTPRSTYGVDDRGDEMQYCLESKALRPDTELSQQQKQENFLQYETDVFGMRSSHEGKAPSASAEDVSEPRRFSVGDVVWGPAKGYASWPGKLEAGDSGRWTVRWFGGDKSCSELPEEQLLTLSEGLEANHAARIKCRKSRKLNGLLEKAIQEAMAELDKSESGAGGRRRRGRQRPRTNR